MYYIYIVYIHISCICILIYLYLQLDFRKESREIFTLVPIVYFSFHLTVQNCLAPIRLVKLLSY